MAVPICQATISGFHTVSVPATSLSPTFTLPLMGDATGSPTEWEWVVASSGVNIRGGAPQGSLVASGVKGSFTNGVATVQNPTAVLDTPGGYTFSLRAKNADGYSDPSYDVDGWRCQANAYILTQAGVKLPAPNQFNYEYDAHDTFNVLASGIVLDTKLPRITYSTAGAINVAAAPGEPSTVRVRLQDGRQRTFSGTLAWDFSNGVADLGLDTGAEQANTWYYLYLVPSSTNDNQLTARASTSLPTIGPTGYTNWKYIGTFRNDNGSNIVQFKQTNKHDFMRADIVGSPNAILTPGSPTYAPYGWTLLDLSSFVPPSASSARVGGKIDGTSSGSFQFFAGAISGGYLQLVQTNGTAQSNGAQWDIPMFTPQTMYTTLARWAGSGNASYLEISVYGWTDQYLS